MDALKKFITGVGITIAGFGMVAGALVTTGWAILIVIGLAIGWLGAVEWKEV